MLTPCQRNPVTPLLSLTLPPNPDPHSSSKPQKDKKPKLTPEQLQERRRTAMDAAARDIDLLLGACLWDDELGSGVRTSSRGRVCP